MSWSTKRQLFIVFLITLLFGAIFGVYYYFLIRVPVSCVDGLQNQDELGVDCGGPCEAICDSEIQDLSIEWVRPFKVSEGVYSVAAKVTNRNRLLGIKNFSYRFALYDDKDVFVSEKNGSIFINPNEKIIIFESNIRTGNRNVKRAFLEYSKNKGDQGWVRVKDLSSAPKLSVGNIVVEDVGKPRISAEIINSSPFPVGEVNVTVAIYDKSGNAMAVSSTFIDNMGRDSTETVNFTWPLPFPAEYGEKDILPRINYTDI